MRKSLVFALPFVASVLASLHCSSSSNTNDTPLTGDGGTAANGDGATLEPDKPLVPATKIDLLFAVDNSASMAAKQGILASSLQTMFTTLTGKVADIHFGIVSSSLGNQGGDVCTIDAQHPRNDDGAHLLNKDANNNVIPGAEQGFLAFGPGGITDPAAFQQAASQMILGVGETGCGFEAQLESVYRFVAQPDPPSSTTGTPGQPITFGATDDVLLAQRKAFFRPDSAVAIVMLTDEDDSTTDPRSVNGAGWNYELRAFPGSKVARGSVSQGTTAPRGTSECASQPTSADCASCGSAATCTPSDPACQKLQADTSCTTSGMPGQSGPGYNGYLAVTDDDLNVRFYDMKQRFGVDPQFPVDRYIQAFTNRQVPNLATEHDADGNYVHAPTCENPLFAASLPASSKEELCKLPDGPRSNKLVLFQLIGGIAPPLVSATPDWTKILGANPDAYDVTGIDPHMLPSIAPRDALLAAGSPDSPRGQNGTDPINGREWDTDDKDLQFACTFPLAAPIDCDANAVVCRCDNDPNGGTNPNPPLCATDGSATQIRAAAYPTVRELRVVKGLADRGLVGSICAADPTSGYSDTLAALATRLSTVLASK